MGMIRKTLSVSTLGLISFRGKKERLERAERAQRNAEESLEREHVARLSPPSAAPNTPSASERSGGSASSCEQVRRSQ